MGFFRNKTILITGSGLLDNATGFLSRKIQSVFAREGANLAITGNDPEKLEEITRHLEYDFDIRVLPIEAVMSGPGKNEEIVKKVIDKTVKTFGEINFLINGSQDYTPGISFLHTTTSDLDRAVYSGIYSTFYYMKYTHPQLKTTRGGIVNVCSKLGSSESKGDLGYRLVTDGIKEMTKTAAEEWKDDGINVNMLSINTTLMDLTKPTRTIDEMEIDVSKACFALLSPSLNYITGECITLKGGVNLSL